MRWMRRFRQPIHVYDRIDPLVTLSDAGAYLRHAFGRPDNDAALEAMHAALADAASQDNASAVALVAESLTAFLQERGKMRTLPPRRNEEEDQGDSDEPDDPPPTDP